MNMMRNHDRPATTRGIIQVEVRLKNEIDHEPTTEAIRSGIQAWISRCRSVRVGQELQLGPPAPAPVLTAIEQVRIAGHSLSTEFPDQRIYMTADHDVDIAVYTLFTDSDSEQYSSDLEDECGQNFTVTFLPHVSFNGLWESLVYEEPVGELTLRALVRAAKESRVTPRSRMTRCKNTILFHGPPGSGKTMLAQALAQRLSIRLSSMYAHTRFLEIDSHALLSKFFGESSKQVGKLFESILDMAKDDSELIVVLFDEVETIASSREKAMQASEVADAVRSTNEMLRGLDKIRRQSNVVFICTSNFISNIDAAFVDRCFLEEFIDAPAVECVYDILRSELNNLIKQGLLDIDTMIYEGYGQVDSSPVVYEQTGLIPDLSWASFHWGGAERTAASELYRIAELAKGLSGRKLGDLVSQAQYKYTTEGRCELQEMLGALERVVRQKTGCSHSQEEPSSVSEFDGVESEGAKCGILEFVSRLKTTGNHAQG